MLICLQPESGERATNELGNRTFVDRRGNPRDVARSAQTARAAKATTSRNTSLGGRRRRGARESRTHGCADGTRVVAQAQAWAFVERRSRTSPGIRSLLTLPSIACQTTRRAPRSPVVGPKTSQRSRSEYASGRAQVRAKKILDGSGRFVARNPQWTVKKKCPARNRDASEYIFHTLNLLHADCHCILRVSGVPEA